MKIIAITALLISATATFHSNLALAQVAPASASPLAATTPLAGTRMAGEGVLRFLGFEIYRARLWVPPGFDADNYTAQPLALTGSDNPEGITPLTPATSMLENTISKVSRLRTGPRTAASL